MADNLASITELVTSIINDEESSVPQKQRDLMSDLLDKLTARQHAQEQVLEIVLTQRTLAKQATVAAGLYTTLSSMSQPTHIPDDVWSTLLGSTVEGATILKNVVELGAAVQAQTNDPEGQKLCERAISLVKVADEIDLDPTVRQALTSLIDMWAVKPQGVRSVFGTGGVPTGYGSSNFLERPVGAVCNICGWTKTSSRGDRKNLGYQVMTHLRDDHPTVFVSDELRQKALDAIWKNHETQAEAGPVTISVDGGGPTGMPVA